ncbi:Na+/H+ antiporter [Rhodococcus sp. (in: high G+C Gram-positive bacteria)]|uniref:Na+/H+ antiporter n=1 Tax=Rhodococcus sp. TaxID=1831 RepID=UPI001A0103BC|nr:Na+/H+ antiporter [Rhodococcus sp. (in: high G+C Gram-positive bacteria)]MBF0660544.1 Na+/H+ antiporter [Rhodococcus sp. (in: high G+C Gram-positive bacteria)]
MNGTMILLVVIAAIAVTGLANRGNLQGPLVLVIIGAIASFLPGLPRLELEPDVLLGVVLPPLLYSAALKFSVPTFRRYLAPILRLGIVTVLATAFAVAFFANWLVPDLTFGAALVLGAVVAPTDAVSAVAVGQKLGLPKRVISILTGEGLVNDATALTLFAVAIAMVAGTPVFADSPVLFFAYGVVGGVAVGLVLAAVVHWVRGRMFDSPLETALGLVLPFAAYLVAEEIHASGVLAVVAAGLYIGHRATDTAVTTRLQERFVWESVDILLEMFVFAYMGLQLKFVLDEVADTGLDVVPVLLYSVAVLAVVILVRPIWGFLNWGRRRAVRTAGFTRLGRDPLTYREHIVVSWAGMRGVVTLAAAGGVPAVLGSGEPFPGRELIHLAALVVAVGTLLIQGATMPMLIRRLDVVDPYERLRATEQRELARTITANAAKEQIASLEKDPPGGFDPDAVRRILERVRRSVKARVDARQVESEDDTEAGVDAGALFDEFRRAVLRAQRTALIAARDDGTLDDESLRAELESLDIEEAAAEERVERRGRTGNGTPPP